MLSFLPSHVCKKKLNGKSNAWTNLFARNDQFLVLEIILLFPSTDGVTDLDFSKEKNPVK